MKITKQATLKLALLLVLAANWSWNGVDFTDRESKVYSKQLALTGGESVPKAAAAPAAAASAPADGQAKPPPGAVEAGKLAAPAPVSPAAAPPPPPAAPAVVSAPAPEAVAVKITPLVVEDTEHEFKICGENHYIVYSEGNGETLMRFKKSSTKEIVGPPLSTPGKHKDAFAIRERIAEKALPFIKKERESKKLSCDDEVVVKGDSRSDEAKDDEARTKRQLARCERDDSGRNLRRTDKLDCLVRQISKLDIKDFEKKGNRRRSNSDDNDAKRAMTAEIRRLQGDIRRLAKDLALGKDSTDQQEAIDAVEDAIRNIKDVADTYDLGEFDNDDRDGRRSRSSTRYNNDIPKMIGELEALKSGINLSEKTRDYAGQAERLGNDRRQAYQEMQRAQDEWRRDPTSYWANANRTNAEQNFVRFNYDYNNFQNSMNYALTPDFTAMQAYRSRGFLSGQDFTDFTKSFDELRTYLNQMGDPTKSPTQTLSGLSTGPGRNDISSLSNFSSSNFTTRQNLYSSVLPSGSAQNSNLMRAPTDLFRTPSGPTSIFNNGSVGNNSFLPSRM